jgi:hypothetical protein
MHAIKTLCSKGIVLKGGQVAFSGTAVACVSKYLESTGVGANPRDTAPAHTRAGSGEWRFTEVAATKATFGPDEPKEFIFHAAPTGSDAGPVFFSGLLVNGERTVLTQFDSRLVGFWAWSPEPVRGRLTVAGPWLKPGTYTLDIHIGSVSGAVDLFEGAAGFEVSPVLPYAQSAPLGATSAALVLADFAWSLAN